MPQPYTPDSSPPPPSYPVPGGEPVEVLPFVRDAAITRRLALAALRLAIYAVGMRDTPAPIVNRLSFSSLARWVVGPRGPAPDHRVGHVAIDEAEAALREAGEVSENVGSPDNYVAGADARALARIGALEAQVSSIKAMGKNYTRARRARLRAAGCCTYCKAPARPNRTTCERHSKKVPK